MGSLVKLVEADRRSATLAFTLIELLVVVGIVSTLSTIVYFQMSKLQTTTDSKTSVDRVVATLRAQRMYAMLGNSNLRIKAMPQGIHFDQGKGTYTQFSCPEIHNCVYDPNDNTNIQNTLEVTLSFSDVNLENNQIIFAPLSGAVYGYASDKNSVTISSSAEPEQTNISITSLGTVNTTKP